MSQPNNLIECPFCDRSFTAKELQENLVAEDFEFKEVPNRDCPGWLCCNLCEHPIEQLEEVEDFYY